MEHCIRAISWRFFLTRMLQLSSFAKSTLGRDKEFPENKPWPPQQRSRGLPALRIQYVEQNSLPEDSGMLLLPSIVQREA